MSTLPGQISAKLFRRNETRVKGIDRIACACEGRPSSALRTALVIVRERNISAKIFGGSPRSCSTIRALFIPLYRARGLANFDGKKWKGARSIKNFAHSRSRNVDPASYLNEGSKSCPFFFSFLLLRNLRRKAVHPRGRERSASNLSYGRPSCRRAPRE